MYVQDNIVAGIVTYNPDIKRLTENIQALLNENVHIHVIDNGSKNYCEINNLIEQFATDCISIEAFTSNRGIATALAGIMLYAKEKNFDWVLSLDQDSVCEKNLIAEYLTAANESIHSDVGIFSCLIVDRNFRDEKYEHQEARYQDVPYCITSASLMNVEKYYQTAGYDEDFFIDAVDFDICYEMREHGFRVVRINYCGLYHEVGHGENKNFLGKQIVVYHQKTARIYYLSRNLVRMYRKHRKLYTKRMLLKNEIALFLKVLFYEKPKMQKISAFWHGISGKEWGEIFD